MKPFIPLLLIFCLLAPVRLQDNSTTPTDPPPTTDTTQPTDPTTPTDTDPPVVDNNSTTSNDTTTDPTPSETDPTQPEDDTTTDTNTTTTGTETETETPPTDDTTTTEEEEEEEEAEEVSSRPQFLDNKSKLVVLFSVIGFLVIFLCVFTQRKYFSHVLFYCYLRLFKTIREQRQQRVEVAPPDSRTTFENTTKNTIKRL